MKLRFSSLDQLRDYVAGIQSDNHSTCKKWTAAQNFYHLAGAFEGSIEGLPEGYPNLIRMLVRPIRWVVTKYRFPKWLPIPRAIEYKLKPSEDLGFEEQKSRLLKAIDAFEVYTDDHPPHPVLGSLTHDQWVGFQLRHCEHHLSFIKVAD